MRWPVHCIYRCVLYWHNAVIMNEKNVPEKIEKKRQKRKKRDKNNKRLKRSIKNVSLNNLFNPLLNAHAVGALYSCN